MQSNINYKTHGIENKRCLFETRSLEPSASTRTQIDNNQSYVETKALVATLGVFEWSAVVAGDGTCYYLLVLVVVVVMDQLLICWLKLWTIPMFWRSKGHK